jgi:hypothetical protein
MHLEPEPISPDCLTTRLVTVGGLTRSELLQELQSNVIPITQHNGRPFWSPISSSLTTFTIA